jgi:peptide-methionine (R)-S-oxide reductase
MYVCTGISHRSRGGLLSVAPAPRARIFNSWQYAPERSTYDDQSTIMRPLIILFASLLFAQCSMSKSDEKTSQQTAMDHSNNPYYSRTDTTILHVASSDWKRILPPDVFEIAFEKGTERAFTGKYWDFEGKGTYNCAVCGNALFISDAKFASSCGWPSFYQTIRPNSVVYTPDNAYGMQRTEVTCGRCGGHLGHIFDDGPAPTGKRFCMNSVVLEFDSGKALGNGQ